MLRHIFTLLGVVALVAFLAGPALAVPYAPYYINNLGTLGGVGETIAYGINDSGQIVGTTTNSDEQACAFFWSNGTMTDLGTPGCDATSFLIGGINNNGTVTGSVRTPTASTYAFVGNSASVSYLLGSAGTDTQQLHAMAINDSGMVVGMERGDKTYKQAFLWTSGGTYTDIGTPHGFYGSRATCINNNGIVGGDGYYDPSEVTYLPFLYDSTTGSTTMLSTAIPGAQTVYAINDNGSYIGEAHKDYFASEVYLHYGTTTVDIGILPGCRKSYAMDLNNNGQAVGQCFGDLNQGGEDKAFLYDAATSQLIDPYERLSSTAQAGWDRLIWASSINDSGQIVGCGVTSDEDIRGFLMTPALPGDSNVDGSVNGTDLNAVLSNYNMTVSVGYTGWNSGDFNGDGSVNGTDLNTVLSNYNQSFSLSSTATVPEPSTLLLMILGLAGLLAWRKRAISTRRVV